MKTIRIPKILTKQKIESMENNVVADNYNTIWVDGCCVEAKEALELMTDDWIDCDNYCQATVYDLRDLCKNLLKDAEKYNKIY